VSEVALWRLARADALETESEAIDKAVTALEEIIPALDAIASALCQNTVEQLKLLGSRRREGAAKLRAAA
jgi:hypothetical protein